MKSILISIFTLLFLIGSVYGQSSTLFPVKEDKKTIVIPEFKTQANNQCQNTNPDKICMDKITLYIIVGLIVFIILIMVLYIGVLRGSII